MKYGIRNYSKILLQLGLFLSLLLVDQFSKYFIRHFGGFYICNPNISWGIPISSQFFWIFWFISIGIIVFLFFKKTKVSNSLSLIFIISGAFSNIIDRVLYDCVIDFINLRFWPVFNFADIFITFGVLILLVRIFKM